MFAEAMERAHSTNADKVVAEMEKTNMEGTLGHIEFYGRNDTYTHAIKYGHEIRHRHVHAVAGRQAGLHLAGEQVPEQDGVPQSS